MFEFLQGMRGRTLEELLRALNQHQVTLPVATAVDLIDRLCALLPGEDPLGGLHTSYVRFTSDARVLICGDTRHFDGRRRRRRQRQDFVGPSFAHYSPEQVMGEKLDERSDVFNLAVLLHECLTGRQLFSAETDLALLDLVRKAKLPERDQRIPVELDAVLRRALSELPKKRQQTVRAFRTALTPFAGASQLDEVLQIFAAVPKSRPLEAPPLPPGDEKARLVYADWLEERGQRDEANWLRMESGLCKLKGAELEKALGELRVLSDKVGTKFMATVARPAVEGCPIRFGFKCPMKWEAMERTEKEEVRRCRGCEQEVHFVRTMDDAWAVAARGGCVSLDPTLVRPDFEPDPEPGSYTGRLAI